MAFYKTGRWFPWRRIVTKTVQESPEKLFRGSSLYMSIQWLAGTALQNIFTTKFSEFHWME